MSFYYGQALRLQLFGQSHAPAVGMVLDGLPAGFKPDMQELARFMARRAPGRNEYSTARREPDAPEFLSGLDPQGRTCGAPLCAVIRNTDTRSGDYAAMGRVPRPGHADLAAWLAYGDSYDRAGGGQFSGRLTAALCTAGGVIIQLLAQRGISVISRIASVGPVQDEGELLSSTAEKPFPTVSDRAGEKMRGHIAALRAQGDSAGGVIECAVLGLPAGLGGALFGGMEGRIASAVFAVPAVKGIEFGAGFRAAEMTGSENNDALFIENGAVTAKTNNCGGILGGITTSAPLTLRAAVKPTPSIAKAQHSVDLAVMEETVLYVGGRHDPCIVPRAVPCIEAAVAVAVCDAMLDAAAQRL